ncbi:MAG: DUF429 domain-containing protein [Candidatus Micrarchaeia archaeon]
MGTIIGIDLAGSEKRDSGLAIMRKNVFIHVGIVHTDNEILKIIKEAKPKLVAIDAPLTLPKGRKSINQKNDVHFRECDIQLRERRIRFFPITLGPMRMLTKRGIKLKKQIEKQRRRVIEVFPGASYDIWNVERKNKGKILGLFKKMGFKFVKRVYTQDEIDAMCCAITGLFALKKKATSLNGKDGCIFIPKLFSKV